MRIIIYLSLIFSVKTFAYDIQQDYEKIKNLGHGLQIAGIVCEDVAQLRFAEKYPAPQFEVLTGVQYADEDGALGELDVVVVNRQTNLVDLIGEVKCWRNPERGIEVAEDQRNRFFESVQSRSHLTFKWLTNESLTFTKEQFSHVQQFVFIAQKGTLDFGFDYELPYTLNELNELRDRILKCQTEKKCKRP